MEMTRERVRELEITSTETIQTEEQRGKTQQKIEQNICCRNLNGPQILPAVAVDIVLHKRCVTVEGAHILPLKAQIRRSRCRSVPQSHRFAQSGSCRFPEAPLH